MITIYWKHLIIIFLGRNHGWIICTLPEPSQLGLANVGRPFYQVQVEPVYAHRVLKYDRYQNSSPFNALYPVFSTRLHRLINVINQTFDLFPVFSDSPESDAETDVFHGF